MNRAIVATVLAVGLALHGGGAYGSQSSSDAPARALLPRLHPEPGMQSSSLADAAAGGSVLALGEVLASVERHFPLVEVARQEREIAAGELQAARGAFDPALRARLSWAPLGYYRTLRLDSWIEQPTPLWGAQLFAGYRLGLGNFAAYDGKQQTNNDGELRVGLQVPLWRNGPIDRRRANITRAELGRDIAGLGLQQQRLEAQRAAAQRYWEWVAAGRRLQIAERLLEIARLRDRGVQARVARGDVAAVEQTENARAIAQREAQVALAALALEQAVVELSIYLRDDEGEPLRVSAARLPVAFPVPRSPLSDGQFHADLAAASTRRPEPARFAAQREQSEVELRLASNQLAPALDVQVLASLDLGAGSPTRQKPELEAGVFLEIPLRNRQARGRMDAARAAARRAQAQVDLARDRVQADVRNAASAIRAAHARVAATRQEVTLALELERAERVRFELGDSTLLFVNLREQAAAEAALREVDALADYHRAVVSYQTATGVGIPEG